MKQPPRWKKAVHIWIGIYPTTTAVLWVLSPFITTLPLPLKTLCLTLVVVPIMVWVMLPFWQKILKNWLES